MLIALSRYNLRSPVGLIRMMIQQSNCFIVVERGVGMQNMMQERALAASGGELRQDSNMGGGQMVSGRLRPDAGRRVFREQCRRRRRRSRRAPRRRSGGGGRSPAA